MRFPHDARKVTDETDITVMDFIASSYYTFEDDNYTHGTDMS